MSPDRAAPSSRSGWLRGLGLSLLLASGASRAQILMADDFEDGGFANWIVEAIQPGSSMVAAQAAAHRGSWGVRLIDGNSTNGPGWDVRAGVPLDSGMGDLHMRAWVRFTTTNGVDALVNFMGTNIYTPSSGVLGEVKISWNNQLDLNGYDRFGNFMQAPSTPPVSWGRWYLFELATTGVGTPDGGNQLYVDGVFRTEVGGLDWIGLTYGVVVIGQGWGNVPWLGEIDFDDVRASAQPHASTLRISSSDASVAGPCIPVGLSFRASRGDPAPAPYDLDVSLAGDGGLAFELRDPTCAVLISGVHFDAGQVTATAMIRVSSTGTLELVAEHPDFLTGQGTLNVTSLGPMALVVGCGCSAMRQGAWPLLLLAVFALGFRVRNRHTTRPP